jgi:hypothetical protein
MPIGTVVAAVRCYNCDAPIAGPFCSSCGQRTASRSLSLGHLLQEAVGDVYHLDSRLWRTLRLLLFQPGQLTLDYVAGRRERYVPPFRLYLVVSFLLFLFTPEASDFGSVPVQLSTPATVQKAIDATKAALAAKRAEIARLGSNDARVEKIAALEERLQEQTDELRDVKAVTGKPGAFCDRAQFEFFSSKRFEPRMRTACHKIEADQGRSLFAAFLHNLPRMMFLFLPLVALFNKILYLRSKRYYVEHLLFFVHLHVFIFLMFVLIVLGNHVLALVPGGVHPPGIVTFLVVMSILSYVYLALRRFYGQGRVKTFIKFGFLLAAYSITLVVTTLITMVYSALTL